ncbi:MAG: hypothetical protein NTX56_06855 [Proteobacteria bacterium]|nr:hypothetical protein [Pseudomonadota bacterium]
MPTTVDAANIINERRREWQVRVSEAGHAGLKLFQDARNDGKRLTLSDRLRLARNLEPIVLNEFPERNSGMFSYQLLQHADLTRDQTNKNQWRLITRDGQAVGDLYADPDRFLRLILALHELLPEDLGVLADRVLTGTSFDLGTCTNIDEAELIWRVLQTASNRVGAKYGLLEACHQVSFVRRKTDDQIAIMATTPIGEGNLPPGGTKILLNLADGFNDLIWPLYDYPILYPKPGATTEAECFASVNAFWSRDFNQYGPYAAGVSGCIDTLYFPHVLVGEVLTRDTVDALGLSTRAESPHLKVVGEHDLLQELVDDPLPTISFDEDTKRYIWAGVGDETEWKATWLLMYPAPDMSRMIPALFQLGELYTGYLLPLSPAVIANFADEKSWWYLSKGNDCESLYERIKQLATIGESGIPQIEEHWMQTAKRFRFNPVLRNYRPSPWVADIEKYLRGGN